MTKGRKQRPASEILKDKDIQQAVKDGAAKPPKTKSGGKSKRRK